MRWTGPAKFAMTAVIAVTAALATPAVAQAAEPVAGGSHVMVSGLAGCTITAAGHDASGTPVAFTAAHCSERLNEPVVLAGTETVIGTVVTRNEVLDYSVIELDPATAVPARQPGVTGRAPAPAFGDVVCKDGLMTGHTCGVTWQSDGAHFWSHACAGHGDSGAPVTRDGRLVGLLSGGHMPPDSGPVGASVGNVLPPCVHPAQSPFFIPALAYSFDEIVADATERNWPGAGFQMA